MKRYLRIYKECIKISFASAATYRFNFILDISILLISNLLFPLVTILIYNSGSSYPGWNFYEVLLIQSIFIISTGFADMLFNGILWATMQHIVDGTFELVLIKPVDCTFLLLASNFQINSITLVLGGTVLSVIAIVKLGGVTILGVLASLLLFLGGLLVMLGFAFMMAATSFKWVANSRIPEIFNSAKQFGNYPQSIFPKVLVGVISFVIPVSMIGFFPASALLGRISITMFLALIPCVLFGLLGIYLFKHMVHLYEGVGG